MQKWEGLELGVVLAEAGLGKYDGAERFQTIYNLDGTRVVQRISKAVSKQAVIIRPRADVTRYYRNHQWLPRLPLHLSKEPMDFRARGKIVVDEASEVRVLSDGGRLMHITRRSAMHGMQEVSYWEILLCEKADGKWIVIRHANALSDKELMAHLLWSFD